MAHVLASELRTSVLQAAMKGLLTKYQVGDELIDVYYDRLILNKENNIKNKKWKKEFPVEHVDNSNYEYDLPKNWMWCYLGDIVLVRGGKRVPVGRSLSDSVTSQKYIRVADMKNNSVVLETVKYLPDDLVDKLSLYTISKDDLYITVAGTIGDVGTIPKELDNANLTENADKIVFENIDKKWLLLCLISNVVQKQIVDATTKVGQPKLAIKRIQSLYIPLCVPEEQARIVARVDELMAKIDEYEKLENELVELKNNFYGDMKAAVLQAAIQGKLTEQLESDSEVNTTVEEMKSIALEQVGSKKLVKNKTSVSIAKDETPFDIPDSWQWVRFGNLVKVISGTSYDKSNIVRNGLRIIRGGNLENLEVVKKDDDVFLPRNEFFDPEKIIKKNDIVVVASTGSISGIGRPSFMDNSSNDEMQIGAFLRIVRPYSDKMYKYIKYIFMSDYYRSHISNAVAGIGIRNLKEEHITALPIPLPPIEEQRRIVEKLDKVLPLCEEFEKEMA